MAVGRRVANRWLCAATMALLTIGGLPDVATAAPPATHAHNAPVLAEGPPPDSDGDGITDDLDACPSEYGVPDNNGCPYVYVPVDTDGDGVNDDTDQCPTDAGSPAYNGCPVPDSDNDGLPDDTDACPTLPGPYDGCPLVDFDNDGVTDDIDQCPNQAGPPDRNGCPLPDGDNDGIVDDLDQCNSTPAGATIDQNGCSEDELDSDGDGVNDDLDQCTTQPGPADNAGCPLTAVTPAQVTFRDRCGTRHDTMTVTATPGVTYVFKHKVLKPGRYVVHGSVIVDARADSGYTLAGTTRWSTTFSIRACRVGKLRIVSVGSGKVRVKNREHAVMHIAIGRVTKRIAADATVTFRVATGRRHWNSRWTGDLSPAHGRITVR